MGFRIKFTEQAEEDLSSIITYIRDDLHSPWAARRFYNEVNKKLSKISDNPFMYPLSRNEKLRAMGYHTATIRNYLLFYIVDETNRSVYIPRIVYGKRDLTSISEE
ncbi:MAG: type II toxin-antitoxin system RelE/ParE family toxin [Firmicutes bacterium]|nr:type II toxin-antitoxin system RelE/ParE family toxin [Bacillota bacterium]